MHYKKAFIQIIVAIVVLLVAIGAFVAIVPLVNLSSNIGNTKSILATSVLKSPVLPDTMITMRS